MDEERLIGYLRAPAYGLYHIMSIEQARNGQFAYDIVPAFKLRYTEEMQSGIIDSLEWCTSRDDFDFDRVLPSIPGSTKHKIECLRVILDRLKALRSNG